MLYLIMYFVAMMGITAVFAKKTNNINEFLTGDGNIGFWEGAFSISATWLWSVALLVSSQKAYSSGIVGLTWFIVPNVLILSVFGRYGAKLRNQWQNGFSIPEYMSQKYGSKVKGTYIFLFAIITLMSTIVNLLAGGKIASLITGLPFELVVVLLGLIALAYSATSGIKASITTDVFQMALVLIVLAVLVPIALIYGGGFKALTDGIGGITGQFNNFLNKDGINVALAFGIPAAISIIGSPFGDNGQWQRVFALKKKNIKKSFTMASLIFGVVPISMGLIGFISAGNKFIPIDESIVALEFAKEYLPAFILLPFMYMLISGLMSTVDSNLCALSSLLVDLRPKTTVNQGRLSMLVLTMTAIAMATIPSFTVPGLFLAYGTLRASSTAITMLTIDGVKLNPKGVFYGLLASMIIGTSIYLYGASRGIGLLQASGSVLALVLSGIVALIYTKIKGSVDIESSKNKIK